MLTVKMPADTPVSNLRPWTTYPAWTAMALVLLVTIFVPAPTVSAVAPYPFLISLVFLGLPHGAWDHRVIAAVRGTALSWHHLVVFCTVYGSMVALYGLLWITAPPFAFVLFILQSWLHWGQGDAAYIRLWAPINGGPPTWLTWLVRGGAPILLPIFRFPEEFARIAGGVTGLFEPRQEQTDWRLPQGMTDVGLLLLTALVATYLLFVLRSISQGDPASRAAAREDATEIALLYAVFAVANPVLAVGIYFCCWHGLRHIGRLLLLDNVSRELCAKGRVATAGARFAVQCLPILVAALTMLWAAYLWAVRSGGDSATTALSIYLAMIACLTFPHFLLVCWLDRSS